jgi:hypothetical protein
MNDIQGSYTSDAKSQSLLSKLAVSALAEPHFSLQNDILRYKGRIWVGTDKALQQQLIQAFRSSLVGGQSGFPATYRRIKQTFA